MTPFPPKKNRALSSFSHGSVRSYSSHSSEPGVWPASSCGCTDVEWLCPRPSRSGVQCVMHRHVDPTKTGVRKGVFSLKCSLRYCHLLIFISRNKMGTHSTENEQHLTAHPESGTWEAAVPAQGDLPRVQVQRPLTLRVSEEGVTCASWDVIWHEVRDSVSMSANSRSASNQRGKRKGIEMSPLDRTCRWLHSLISWSCRWERHGCPAIIGLVFRLFSQLFSEGKRSPGVPQGSPELLPGLEAPSHGCSQASR